MLTRLLLIESLSSTKLLEKVSLKTAKMTLNSAKYDLDNLLKQKNEISKIVAQKKKDSKG